MLRTVVHEDPAYILHAGAKEDIADEDQQPHQPFGEAFAQIAPGQQGENAGADQLGQQEKQPHRQHDSQNHRQGDDYLFQRFPQLFRQPFFKLGGFLLYGFASQLRRTGQGAHALADGFHKGHHPPYDGQP